jgi:hypothetical protein
MAKLITDRANKLRELWLRAQHEDIVVPCPTKSAAITLRFQFYNAVRAVRLKPELSPQLAKVLDLVQIQLRAVDPPDGSGTWELRIGQSGAADALDEVCAKLGVTGKGVQVSDPVALAAEESLRRLSAGLEQADDAGTGTPLAPKGAAQTRGYPMRRTPERS